MERKDKVEKLVSDLYGNKIILSILDIEYVLNKNTYVIKRDTREEFFEVLNKLRDIDIEIYCIIDDVRFFYNTYEENLEFLNKLKEAEGKVIFILI